ncbi:3-hydroxyacyl-CoA dehydrogenase NAD-binding domain-containing protein [Pseudonocardia sp. GCM10023141]|uniref:3-hydroxyacyl-CoA dehydrogenase NAD-binding domain-containing protein n=1 Tax=Pseudonocardia sp. GCM10023141 TaxID=3252653 RepID=UPI0036224CEB
MPGTDTTDLGTFADRHLVVEAVAEDEQAKAAVFGMLDDVVEDREAVFASNTSSIPIMRIAMATRRPHRVVGVHLFNPVPALRLVELIPSLCTDADTTQRVEEFVTSNSAAATTPSMFPQVEMLMGGVSVEKTPPIGRRDDRI